jgi:transmembrane sensor
MIDRVTSAQPGGFSDELFAQAAAWVVRVQSSEATESDFSQWEEWLAADASHSPAYEAAEEIWMLTAQIKPIPWPTREELAAQTASDHLTSRIRLQPPGYSRARRRVAVAAAAAFALAVGGAAWVVATFATKVLETTTAEQRSVRLADGSRVTLAAETRLVVERPSERRLVTLERGEAYFEVAPDPLHPFVVRVRDHEAIAVGTAFNVEAQGDRMTVTVTEGVVKLRTVATVSKSDSPAAASELQLAVGDRAAADRAGAQRLAATAAPESAVAWRAGRLEYLHESLSSVINDVNRYSEHKIVIADASVGALQFTGTVLLDRVDAWLSALPGTFPVEIVTRDNQRFLQSAN